MTGWELWDLQAPTFRDDSPLGIKGTSSTSDHSDGGQRFAHNLCSVVGAGSGFRVHMGDHFTEVGTGWSGKLVMSPEEGKCFAAVFLLGFHSINLCRETPSVAALAPWRP